MTHLSPSPFALMPPVVPWFEINAQWSEQGKRERQTLYVRNQEVFKCDFADNFKVALPHWAVCFSFDSFMMCCCSFFICGLDLQPYIFHISVEKCAFKQKCLTLYASLLVKSSCSIWFPSRIYLPLPSPLCELISCFTPWWKPTPKCLFHPVHWISQMNIDYSPSFTVSCVCFVLDLQQPVSHLHRLSGVDWANESVCAWLCSGRRGTVCSHILANGAAVIAGTSAGANSRCSFYPAELLNSATMTSLWLKNPRNGVTSDE